MMRKWKDAKVKINGNIWQGRLERKWGIPCCWKTAQEKLRNEGFSDSLGIQRSFSIVDRVFGGFLRFFWIFRHAIKDEALKIRSSALTHRDGSIRTPRRLRKTCQMLNPTIPSSWPWAAGNIRFFSRTFLSKKSTSHRPSGISSKSKKLLQVILYLSLVQRKYRARNFFLLDFSISGQQKVPDLPNIFFIWDSFYRDFVRQVPHVASHPRSLFPGISNLGKAPAEGRPKPVQPQPQRAQG